MPADNLLVRGVGKLTKIHDTSNSAKRTPSKRT